MTELTDEARAILAEIEAMSQDNATGSTTYTVRVVADRVFEISVPLPWARSFGPRAVAPIEDFLTPETVCEIGPRWDTIKLNAETLQLVRPVYDGDPSEGLTAAAAREITRRRMYARDALDWALWDRENEWQCPDHHESNAERTYKTHRAVHEALAGEPTSGCKWRQRSVG